MTDQTILLNYNKESVQKAAEVLKNGGLCAIPTETVYGLAANAYNESAVANIFKAKGRPSDNPLIVHISNIDSIHEIVCEFPPEAHQLAEAFWPGALTIILPKTAKIPAIVSGNLDTVAVRMPSHQAALDIISAAGVPLAAPSANLSGSPSPTSASHVLKDLGGKIDMIIDGGNSKVGIESTVLTLAGATPRILRPGAVTREMIERVIGEIEIDTSVTKKLEAGKTAASPGMKYKHYSPKADIAILDGDISAFIQYIAAHKGDGVYALCFEGEEAQIPAPCVTFGSENDPDSQAARLFSALRELDLTGAARVYARIPNRDGVSLAVYNRLIRACGFEVIKL